MRPRNTVFPPCDTKLAADDVCCVAAVFIIKEAAENCNAGEAESNKGVYVDFP